jgi:hypothetical protein
MYSGSGPVEIVPQDILEEARAAQLDLDLGKNL